jgi:uncharacterized membrane protein
MSDSSGAIRSHREERVVIAIDRAIYRFAQHWLLVFNTIAFVFASLPFVIPYLASIGYTRLASWLYVTFGLVCHQRPERSFYLFGEQMALCHRMTAIYVGTFIGGVVYASIRSRVRPLGYRGMVLLATPMAIDGFTQLFGLRESVWELRLLTGSLFAIGVLWFALPRLEQGFAEIRAVLERRFDRPVRQGRARPLS